MNRSLTQFKHVSRHWPQNRALLEIRELQLLDEIISIHVQFRKLGKIEKLTRIRESLTPDSQKRRSTVEFTDERTKQTTQKINAQNQSKADHCPLDTTT